MKYAGDELFFIATAMERYGGSFVQCLGTAIKCADDINKKRVIKEFGDYIEEYYQKFVKPRI